MHKALGLLLVCVGCKDPTEITLEISTNVPCASLGEVAIIVGPTVAEVEKRAPNTTTTMCDSTGTIGTIVVIPSGAIDAHVAIEVTARVKQPGDVSSGPCLAPFGPSCIVARRSLGFVPHTPLKLPIVLDGTCAGLVCSPDETCDHGACLPVTACDVSGCTPADGGSPFAVEGCGDMRGLEANAAWPMLSYCPTRIGRSPFNGPHKLLQTLSVPLNVGSLTSPVIGADGTIYVAGDTAIVALAPDLTVKWSHPISGPTASAQTDTSPVIASDGTVWIGSGSSQRLYAVTPQGATAHDVGFYFGTPVIDPSGTLIFSAVGGASLRGIDSTGAQVFDVGFNGELHTSPARGWDGTLYVGTNTSLFATVHPPSSYTTADLAPAFDFETPVVHPSGLVLAPVGSTQSESVAVFDSTGALAWTLTLPGMPRFCNGSAVGTDGRVFMSTAIGFSVIDVGTRQATSFPPLDNDTSGTRTPILGADGTVYIGKGPTLYAVKPDGTILFAFKTAGTDIIQSSPAIAKDGWLYITDDGGHIHRLHD